MAATGPNGLCLWQQPLAPGTELGGVVVVGLGSLVGMRLWGKTPRAAGLRGTLGLKSQQLCSGVGGGGKYGDILCFLELVLQTADQKLLVSAAAGGS